MNDKFDRIILADRQRDSQRLIDKYPGKKPIILQKSKSSEIPAIDKFKYLMPTEMTVSQVINVIRKYFKTDQVILIFKNCIYSEECKLPEGNSKWCKKFFKSEMII